MNEQLVVLITYFVLAIFIGFEVISKVPTILHTPLMSGSNAIHGIILYAASEDFNHSYRNIARQAFQNVTSLHAILPFVTTSSF